MLQFLRRKNKISNALVVRANQLCIHRGAILAQWAGIESAVDQANHYGWHYSRELVGNVVPQSLRWKKQTFERLHVKSLPFLALQTQANDILRAIERYEQDRHFLVHGVWDHEEGDGWLLRKSVFEKDGSVSIAERHFTNDELMNLQVELMDLVKQVVAYMHALIAQIEQHALNNQGG
jgi:hypothetical protein